MVTMTSTDKDFTTWTKQTCINHPDILEQMLKSISPLERAIAVRVIKNATGVSQL
ncbi:MAG: hypothetical protein NHB15_16910 [Methanosarcina barkeri]|nr:hypothetical protein [Methanosarcina sp. ERenArc_MAG2]